MMRPGPKAAHQLVMGMVFHAMNGAGTLAEHVSQITGIAISNSALSQRRGNLDWEIFESILGVALKLRAKP
ncbi:MAG: hypothetical protein HY299_21900 [Verrucomicrobia bacterium]|nr:hypothetical protein [Verrucomicrobiota bacterium]